jgi:hypothetical protein
MLFREVIKCLIYYEGLLKLRVDLLAFKTVSLFRILPISSLGFALYEQNYACKEEKCNTQAKQLCTQSEKYTS